MEYFQKIKDTDNIELSNIEIGSKNRYNKFNIIGSISNTTNSYKCQKVFSI